MLIVLIWTIYIPMDNYTIMLSLMVGSDAFNLITIGGIGGFHLRDWGCVSCLRLYQPDDEC